MRCQKAAQWFLILGGGIWLLWKVINLFIFHHNDWEVNRRNMFDWPTQRLAGWRHIGLRKQLSQVQLVCQMILGFCVVLFFCGALCVKIPAEPTHFASGVKSSYNRSPSDRQSGVNCEVQGEPLFIIQHHTWHLCVKGLSDRLQRAAVSCCQLASYLTVLFFGLFVYSWSPDSKQLKTKLKSCAGDWSRWRRRFVLLSLSDQ